MVLVLVIGAFDSPATASAQKWLLLEPPVEGTSELGKVLDEAPIAQWNRIGTYDTEGTCEARRNEAVQATKKKRYGCRSHRRFHRLTCGAPLIETDGALRPVTAFPQTTLASRRNRRGEDNMTRQCLLYERPRPDDPAVAAGRADELIH